MTKSVRSVLVGIAVLLALTSTGCSGGDSNSGGSKTKAASKEEMRAEWLTYAKCMRDHGVSWYPDTMGTSDDDVKAFERRLDADPKTPSALRQCAELMPQPGNDTADKSKQLESQRTFAKCMREQGIDYYPDPTGEGAASKDPALSRRIQGDPKFPAAERKCTPAEDRR